MKFLCMYVVAGGGSVSGIRAREDIVVELILGDRSSISVSAKASILPGEEEVVVSDRLAHELGIVIIDPYEGLWCLRDEIGKTVRQT